MTHSFNLILLLFLLSNSKVLFAQPPKETIEKLNLTKLELLQINENRILILTDKKGKQIKIKEQIPAVLFIKNDTIEREIIIEAFLDTQVIVAFLKPVITNGKAILDFEEHKRINYSEISKISVAGCKEYDLENEYSYVIKRK